eukprot:7240034-Prymnesium_polylepis.1
MASTAIGASHVVAKAAEKLSELPDYVPGYEAAESAMASTASGLRTALEKTNEVIISRLRIVANTMIHLPRVSWYTLTVFFMFMSVYAVVGMEAQLMAPTQGRLSRGSFQIHSYVFHFDPDTCGKVCPSFETFGNALLALFQVFVGSSWSGIMFDSMAFKD